MSAIAASHKGTVLMAFDVCHRDQVITYTVGQVIEVDGPVYDKIKGSDKAVVVWDGEPAPSTETLMDHIRTFKGQG